MSYLKEVRILLLGESGVGKTSLILSLVSEQFIDENDSFSIPSRLEPILIPAEVTLENVPGLIIDTSLRDTTNILDINLEIKRANVICLVYSMNNDDTKHKLGTYWLPKIRELQLEEENFNDKNETLETLVVKKPIVLVGNKCDLNEINLAQDTYISNLVLEYTEIETCIECSAKSFKNITELFYYAQKSVLYPTIPVYNINLKELTQQCCKCLTRIFKLCDQDNDNVLNDIELNEFQFNCFNISLQKNALEEVKQVIRSKISDGLDKNNYLTLNGFLLLNKLFIEKGRHETTWTILKKFGYDRYLTFNKDYIYQNLNISSNCTTELTQKGFEFLNFLFNKYDKDKDLCLNNKELNDLFSVCNVIPWGKDVNNTVQTDNNYLITIQGFLSQWVLTTYLDINKAMELISILGYNNYYHENQKSAFIVTRSKLTDNEKKQTFRNTFLCYVYGRKKCGKTAFLQGLLGRDLHFQALTSKEDLSKWTCNLIPIGNQDKYLILKEINSTTDIELHEAFPPDVVVLLYDLTDPNSFSFISDIYLNIYHDKKYIPCLIVGTKCDQTKIQQNYPITPEEFTKTHNLPPPQLFSASSAFLSITDVYQKIITIACMPKMYPMKGSLWRLFQRLVSSTTTKKTNRFQIKNKSIETNDSIVKYSIILAACFTLSFVIIKYLK